jgi:hypothetical protein
LAAAEGIAAGASRSDAVTTSQVGTASSHGGVLDSATRALRDAKYGLLGKTHYVRPDVVFSEFGAWTHAVANLASAQIRNELRAHGGGHLHYHDPHTIQGLKELVLHGEVRSAAAAAVSSPGVVQTAVVGSAVGLYTLQYFARRAYARWSAARRRGAERQRFERMCDDFRRQTVQACEAYQHHAVDGANGDPSPSILPMIEGLSADDADVINGTSILGRTVGTLLGCLGLGTGRTQSPPGEHGATMVTDDSTFAMMPGTARPSTFGDGTARMDPTALYATPSGVANDSELPSYFGATSNGPASAIVPNSTVDPLFASTMANSSSVYGDSGAYYGDSGAYYATPAPLTERQRAHAAVIDSLRDQEVEEYATALCIVPSMDADLMERVRSEVLARLPPRGWALERSRYGLRFVDRRHDDGLDGPRVDHPDNEFLVDEIKQEACRRNRLSTARQQKLNAALQRAGRQGESVLVINRARAGSDSGSPTISPQMRPAPAYGSPYHTGSSLGRPASAEAAAPAASQPPTSVPTSDVDAPQPALEFLGPSDVSLATYLGTQELEARAAAALAAAAPPGSRGAPMPPRAAVFPRPPLSVSGTTSTATQSPTIGALAAAAMANPDMGDGEMSLATYLGDQELRARAAAAAAARSGRAGGQA